MKKKIKAKFVKRLPSKDWKGHAVLYRLSDNVEFERSGKKKGKTVFVVVSAVTAFGTDPETYIFPTTSKGKVKSWLEMPGSFRGALDHEQAIKNAGWEMDLESKSPTGYDVWRY